MLHRVTLLVALLMLVGCSSNQPNPPQALLPTSVPSSPPTLALAPTVAPSSLPSEVPASPTALPPTQTPPPPTLTPLPPSPTPEPYPELAQYTIEGLRNRSYGDGQIEILGVMEETANFTRYLFAYPSDGLRITGMLNRPRGDGPFPVVILNHGYYPLDVYRTGNGTQRAADYLADRGFLTLSPDFRSHADSDDAPNLFRAGHVIDTLNLIPLAQQLPEAQPGKILMWGHSNGGAITAKVIAVSDQVSGALIYAPASSNIVEDYWFRVERAAARGQQIDAIDWPVKPEEAPDLYARLSPLNYARYVSARVLIIWGTNDEVVPRKWPEDLYISLRDAGKDVEFVVYEGQPHSFNAAGNARYLPQMADFFRAVLESTGT